MDSSDKAELERLRAAWASSRAAAAAWREWLIESLGNHMCGSGPGPTPDEIDLLAFLEQAEQRASESYAAFLISISRKDDRRG
jgi:hypothetical protein